MDKAFQGCVLAVQKELGGNDVKMQWAGWLHISVDHHVLASLSLIGMLCDVMGGLYLAYDLLGGQDGLLRTLTRGVTYAFVFGTIYGLVLGLLFGLVAGPGLALVVLFEVRHIHITHPDRASSITGSLLLVALLRGGTFGLAAGLTFGAVFGVTFGLFSGLGLIAVYLLRVSPTEAYLTQGRLHVKRRELQGSLVRGAATGLAGILAGVCSKPGMNALVLGLLVGIVVGVASSVGTPLSAFMEWWADHLPARWLGNIGAVFLLIGLLLISVQYWLMLFDIPVR